MREQQNYNIRTRVELDVLPRVRKPGRYTGGELNAVVKPDAEIRLALCFPEVYEIGMSNHGFMLLYHLVNEIKWAACERAFAPWPDMEQALSRENLPLYSLETFTPLDRFDVVGFSLSYEMTYSNVLTMLHAGGIPLRREDRGEKFPLVAAGGSCALNPEPMSDFIDVFAVGEGEEMVVELLEAVRKAKKGSLPRLGLLEALAGTEGFYVPEVASVDRSGDGFSVVAGMNRGKFPIRRRFVENLDRSYYPAAPVVPGIETVHDRMNVEIFRGCTRGCRYCQAGMIYRPHRERGPERVKELSRDMYRATGCEEVSLLSLNAPDYTRMDELLDGLSEVTEPEKVSISMPSTRVDTFSSGLGEKLRRIRGTSLTLAPEAGTQRLRDIINKRVTDDDIDTAVGLSRDAGWKKAKLYFMIGLPGETQEDLEGIVNIVRRLCRKTNSNRKRKRRRRDDFNISISSFVPKPHTPFQWEPMDSRKTLAEKQEYLRAELRRLPVKADFHDVERSFLEGVFSRGDRRLGRAIEEAWNLGARFDGWSDMFDHEIWKQAFEQAGIDPGEYAGARHRTGARLPWSHVETGVSEKYLMIENRKAMAGDTTGCCLHEGCTGCGLDCGQGSSLLRGRRAPE